MPINVLDFGVCEINGVEVKDVEMEEKMASFLLMSIYAPSIMS